MGSLGSMSHVKQPSSKVTSGTTTEHSAISKVTGNGHADSLADGFSKFMNDPVAISLAIGALIFILLLVVAAVRTLRRRRRRLAARVRAARNTLAFSTGTASAQWEPQQMGISQVWNPEESDEKPRRIMRSKPTDGEFGI
eukprot:69561_1